MIQIDIQLNLSIIISKKLSLSENFKLDSAAEDYLFRLLKNVEVTKQQYLTKFQENV